MTRTFRPDLAALEEKISELEESVAHSQDFLRRWSKLKQDEVDKAEATLRAITPQWNGLKKQRTAQLTEDKEHIEVLKSSIEKLKVDA